ncbi:MAG: tRNA 4-thiouridine(8) synthase ThiI [Syntrophobacterales bacterium]|nr:tRNA 4-thiouridine(8) synthase ThiI [Syntrophobacterales bacterium]
MTSRVLEVVPGTYQKIKAIGLISGGLDSLIAAKLIQDQGIEVIGITFSSPFWDYRRTLAIGEKAGIPMKVIDMGEEHFGIVKNPTYGYGSYMNPCIDCHALMIKKAAEVMEETGASFIFTGEVVGQRPMSQRKEALRIIEKLSGYEGKILRPLSALLLPESEPEKQGLVDRSRLLGIGGRGRKEQLSLAKYYGIMEYDTPGGGCLLTKEGYAKKLKVLLSLFPNAHVRHAEILKYGRLFVIQEKFCLVVGRHSEDNAAISTMAKEEEAIFYCKKIPGPVGILLNLRDHLSESVVQEAALILASLSDAERGHQVEVSFRHLGRSDTITVIAIYRDQLGSRFIK